jgi:hypothetical protein
MNILLDGRLLNDPCGPDHARAMRVRQSGNAAPRLLKQRCSAQYCEHNEEQILTLRKELEGTAS